MTAKEAIDWLNCLKEIHEDDISDALDTWYKDIKNDHNEVIDMAIEALEAQNTVVHMDLPKISEDDIKKMLTKMNYQQQLEWIVDGTIPNNFGKDANVPSNNLIDRQAVIDAMANTLWHYPNECYRNLNEYEFSKGLAELGLKSVPSAQPEIIRCKECKHSSYCYSEVHMLNRLRTTSICKDIDFCSYAERCTDADMR